MMIMMTLLYNVHDDHGDEDDHDDYLDHDDHHDPEGRRSYDDIGYHDDHLDHDEYFGHDVYLDHRSLWFGSSIDFWPQNRGLTTSGIFIFAVPLLSA